MRQLMQVVIIMLWVGQRFPTSSGQRHVHLSKEAGEGLSAPPWWQLENRVWLSVSLMEASILPPAHPLGKLDEHLPPLPRARS